MTLRITVDYDSIWQTSFLDGSNNEHHKKERKFVGSMSELRKPENHLERSITVDTVMGVLNLLVGDVRKLYQSREDPEYYFKELESVLTPEHIKNIAEVSDESILLQNFNSGLDKKQMAGIYQEDHEAFTNPALTPIWDIAFLPLPELLQFILTAKLPMLPPRAPNPLMVADRLDEINGMKAIDIEEGSVEEKALEKLREAFPDVSYTLMSTGKFRVMAYYASALYLMMEKLEREGVNTEAFKSSQGGIGGTSKRSFTRTDFMRIYAGVKPKKTFLTPYIIERRVKELGLIRKKVSVATGQVEIHLPLSLEKAHELVAMIHSAGVSTFRLGKKGLAFVSSLTIQGIEV